MRNRPRRGLLDLESDVNRMLDSFFSRSQDLEGDGEETASAVWAPRMDLTETDDAYRVQMDLPGLKKGDLNVRMDDHRLLVSGERAEETTSEDEDHVHSERYFGSFYRSVRLPMAVEEENIKANFKNGVLTIDLPKSEKSKPKQIEIS
jgi:HSP20 family protein